jgi:hypothetical protein
MLNYEPHPTNGAAFPYRQHWALAWHGETLPEPSLLRALIAAARQNRRNPAPAPAIAPLAPQTFQPERMSGLCASI